MSKLATDCVATLVGFIEAYDKLKILALECCSPERRNELRLQMSDVTTRAGQVKAHVMALKTCVEAKPERTLQEVQAERQAMTRVVPVLPERELLPPPPNYQEMVPP